MKIYGQERAAMKYVQSGVCAELDVYLGTLALTLVYAHEW